MKHRDIAYAILQRHISGYYAPPICIHASSHAEAYRIAKEKSHLVSKYPDKWVLA